MIESNVSLETIWSKISSNLKELISPQQYKTWFKSIKLLSCKDHKFSFAVPNKFLRNWIANYYLDDLNKAINRSVGASASASFTIEVDSSMNKKDSKEEVKPTSANSDLPSLNQSDPTPNVSRSTPNTKPVINRGFSAGNPNNKHHSRSSTYKVDDFYLNPSYVFDDFIVGPCNQLSYAACVAVSENLSQAYNPLFIHGSSGLGKTHLLQAICHNVLPRKRDIKILFLSCETFINHFIAAVGKGDVGRFRDKYRHIDLLLIDDIHLLANKERTQEEFFHTFNSLYNNGKQIVLSSDTSPSEIPTLEERLVSRFKWGLVVEVYPPDFETRCAILKQKARLKGVEVPDDVIAFLSENISTNIRELEGAITKVIGYATLMNKKLNISMAHEAMKDIIKRSTKFITINHVVKKVILKYDVKLADLQSKKRTQVIALPRQTAMYLIKELTTHSLQEIGAFFGGRDHTTVLHAHNKITTKMSKDDRFKSLVDNLMMDVKNSV